MIRKSHVCDRVLLMMVLAVSTSLSLASAAGSDTDLAGLWESRRNFGPQMMGPLLIREIGDQLVAEIGGHRMDVDVNDSNIAFAIRDGSRFEGVRNDSGNIHGHWLQRRSRLDGNVFATPVLLRRRSGGWSGDVVPQPDTGTFYLLLRPGDGSLAAELINPERNLGVFTQLTQLVREGNSISLLGSFRGRGEQRTMLRGSYYPEEEVLGLRYPRRGGGYDFHRVDPERANGFLARSSDTNLVLSPPPELEGGWRTASMSDVGIDSALIRQMIETHILPQPTSTHDLSIHALLVARKGKLVVEEYFHDYNRNLPHDSRSASKGVTSILAAAVMESGADLHWDMPVYPLFDTEELLEREPSRGNITLRHLVNMNTGLDCDDRNPQSAANEDYLWDHADDLDFYRHTINVEVMHPPNQVVAYCSASANLAGGVIAAAAEESLLQLIHRLLAEPLEIQRYSVPMSPDGHPFMGGGIRWLPRDFLKFPQLILDGGQWNGRRVIGEENAQRLITPAVKIDGGRDYGYLWWTTDYPYKGRSVRAHFMGGNGGQIAMLVPELELSLVFQAGNYSDRVMFKIQNEIIPNFSCG